MGTWISLLRRKSAEPAATSRLPPELMQHIATFLPDRTTFFAYLQAYSSSDDVIGAHLINLWRLGQLTTPITGRSDALWPRLRVDSRPPQSSMPYLEAILKHYTAIPISGEFDLTWLDHIPASALSPLHLYLRSSTVPKDVSKAVWSASWSKLPITLLDATFFHSPTADAVLDTLPSLMHLASLRVGLFIEESRFLTQLHALVQVLPNSKITSLTVDCDSYYSLCPSPVHLTTPMFTHLTLWLKTRPVQHVSFSLWSFADVAPAATSTFWDAISTCATLTSLSARDSVLAGLASHVFPTPLPMTTVALEGCSLSHPDVHALCTGLTHSRLATLKLTRLGFAFTGLDILAQWLPQAVHLCDLELLSLPKDIEQLEALWTGLTQSHVTSLRLSGQKLLALAATFLPRTPLTCLSIRDYQWRLHDGQEWRALAQAVSRSSLTALDVSCNNINDEHAAKLASGLDCNHRLAQLTLDQNYITAIGAMKLLHAMTASAAASRRTLSLKLNEIHGRDRPNLLANAQGTPTRVALE
ncbi:Aste57867_574 [Aphanomyces stellatus]|uniref:Aste57867_574 protein n=1 Tax=Aphanomyces stellatus TaxID=120398 RepID=A0A485K7Z1_9STRA|nr:hypothetical protein As57867_000573 [Aphanomyces stellatus]VFT77799.1 Aste57867_574 [Aphanomyces stellatus]